MSTRIPAERTLPHKQEILERVLADQEQSVRRTGGRGWLVPVSAAAGIAVIVGGVVVLGGNRSDGSGEAPAAGTTTARTPSTAPSGISQQAADISVNLGPVNSAEASALAEACIDSTATDPNGPAQIGPITRAVKVPSWGRQRTVDNSVVVKEVLTGLTWGCVGVPTVKDRSGNTVQGFDAVLLDGKESGKTVLNRPDATHPAATRDGGAVLAFVELDRKPDLLIRDCWYEVDGRVAKVRQRFVFADRVGPWFVADPVGRYVFLRSWDESAVLKAGETVRVETQVLDRNGNLLDAPADQKGGGGLKPSPGTTRVDVGTVVAKDPTLGDQPNVVFK
ncbi:hypothetical protein [Kribbella endophytica]